MDCYFHSNVPSVAACVDCRKPICATCRDERGSCPGCRLAAKVEAATATRTHIGGQVPPPHPQPATVIRKAEVATLPDSVESRALVSLGYPLWPLALLSLLDRKQSRYLRRQALQALGFNVAILGIGGIMSVVANLPWIGLAPSVLLPFLVPLFLVASVYYGIKTWNGDDVRVPIVGDWIEERLPLDQTGQPETNAR
ncbi:MAG TPA: DUF4870 domain-containing protein [Candidatus Baltobacteraceae bacterium]|jgi:uncharacterized membrane protein